MVRVRVTATVTARVTVEVVIWFMLGISHTLMLTLSLTLLFQLSAYDLQVTAYGLWLGTHIYASRLQGEDW